MLHNMLSPLFISITFVALIWSMASARISLVMQYHRPVEAALAVTNTPTRTPTPINVGNFVWDDLNGNGVQNAGEPGLANVTIQLWNGAKTQLFSSTVTNASGVYKLVAPTPGQYRVRVLLPHALDQFSPKDLGGDDLLDNDINPAGTDTGFTDIYNFGSNLISITSIDGGITVYRPPTPTRTPTPINVGNFIWHDLNANGIQESGEYGLNGIQVQLWNAAKTQLISSSATNPNGSYTLIAPTPGDYRVRVLLPSGAFFTPKDVGGSDLADSDINPSGVNAGFTDIYTFGSNLISITTIDAGLTNVQATPTFTNTPTVTNTPTATPTGTPISLGAVVPRTYLPAIRVIVP
jgi:hypothetical protein